MYSASINYTCRAEVNMFSSVLIQEQTKQHPSCCFMSFSTMVSSFLTFFYITCKRQSYMVTLLYLQEYKKTYSYLNSYYQSLLNSTIVK